MMQRYFWLIVFCILNISAQAGGIKGYIQDEGDEPLAYATIYVKQLSTGTTANAQGYFELSLPKGNYTLVFRHLGYKTSTRSVEIKDDYVELRVKLSFQEILLQNVEISASDEDPAYYIMSNAIAKSKYHLNLVDSSYSKVYMKGTGKIEQIPFLFRGALQKEGIDTSRVFVTESVSEVFYKRPNHYRETVLSVRKVGEANNTNPMMYVNASFYYPEVGEALSPLSPKAFSYYNFEYLGTFNDQGYEINKIKVIPKSSGDDIFRGVINIVEDEWSIYSLQLSGAKLGIHFEIDQSYEPIRQNIWLPVSHQFKVTGKVFGFGFEYQYLASVTYQKVFENIDLTGDIQLTTEENLKIKERAERSIPKKLSDDSVVTRKELKKLMKEYEREGRKQSEEPEVVYSREQSIDSLAYNKDSIYWQEIRPIPLSKQEIRGYQQMDSIAKVEKKKDSIESDDLELSFLGPLSGKNFSIGKTSHIELKSILSGIQFNTVEGVNTVVGARYVHQHFKIGPDLRYAFARNKLTGKLDAEIGFGKKGNRGLIQFSTGRYVQQFNPSNPISPFVNSLMTLFAERNYLKIIERDFIDLSLQKTYHHKFNIDLGFSLAERRFLQNNSKYRFVNRENITYTSNAPENIELDSTSFSTHRAFQGELTLRYQPWLKFSKINGNLQPIRDSSPTFMLGYRKGFPDVFSGVTDFDLLKFGMDYQFDIGIRATVNFTAEAGAFLNRSRLYFMDFQHFMGNRTPFLSSELTGRYRLLDYYRFSTAEDYLTGQMNYHMRKFLLTRIPLVRMTGLRENLIFSYLKTSNSPHYLEIGYGLDYILRIFRLEIVSSFLNTEFQSIGIRFGFIPQLNF